MADNDLRILISASLNVGKSVGDINEAIKAIEKHPSLQKIKLKIDIDQNFTQTINGFINAVAKMKKISDEQNKTVSENVEIYKKLDGTVQQVTQKVLKNGEIIQRTKTVHDESKKAMLDESQAAQKLAESIDKLNKSELDSISINRDRNNKPTGYTVKSSQGYTATTQRLEADGQTIKSSTETTNYLKQRIDALKEQKRINEQAEAIDRAHYYALKDNNARIEAQEKLHYVALQQNLKREEDFIKRKADLQSKIADAQRRYAGDKTLVSSLDGLLGNVQQIKSSAGNYKKAIGEVESQLKQIVATANSAQSHSISFAEALRQAFTKFPIWMIATTAFYAPLHALQSGVKTIYELDKAMTDLQKVTDGTTQQYAKFQREAQQTAQSIGALTVDVDKSAAAWARMGYNQLGQAQGLARETLLYKNVGDIDTAERASEFLISTIKGFRMEVDSEAKNVRGLVDMFNEVSNKYAISAQGIGEALKRSSASMKEAGNTVQESIALVTAGNAVIQDPARVGNALKTISMRIRGISDDGEDLTNLVPTLEKKFESLGLTLKKTDSSFKSTYEIFQDLSKVWGKLDEFQRADILELVAGKLQGNIAASIITNFKDAQGALNAALNSTGSATKENERFLNSIEGKLNQLKNSLTGFWSETINSDFIKGIVEMGTGAINTLTKLSSTIGTLPTTIGIASAAFLLFSSNVRGFVGTAGTQMLSWLGISKNQFISASLSVNLFATSLGMGTTAARIFTTAVMGISRAFAPLAILSAITFAISALTDAWAKNAETQKQIEEQNKRSIDSWVNHRESIEKLKQEYEDLSKATNNGKNFVNVEQETKYYEVTNKLAELLPNVVERIDEKQRAHLKNAEAIERELNIAKQLAEIDARKQISNANSEYKDNIDEYNTLKANYETKKQIYEADQAALDKLIASGKSASEEQINIVERAKIRMLEADTKMQQSAQKMRENLLAIGNSMQVISGIQFSDQIKEELSKYTESLDVTDEKSRIVFQNVVTELITLQKELKTAGDDADKQKEAFNSFSEKVSKIKSGNVRELANNVSNVKEKIKEANEVSISFEKVNHELDGKFKTSAKSLEILNGMLEDHARGKKISAAEAMKLIEADASLVEMFKIENGQITLNIQAVENKKKAEIDAYDKIFNMRKSDLISANQVLVQKLSVYGIEIEALGSLEEAYKKIDDIYAQRLENAQTYSQAIGLSNEKESVKKFLGQIDELKKKAELARAALTSIGTSKTPQKEKKEKKEVQLKDALEEQDLTKELIASFQGEYEARKKINEAIERRIKLSEKQKDYNKAITETTELIKSQEQSVKDLESANKKLHQEANQVRDSHSKFNKTDLSNEEFFNSWFDINDEATPAYKEFINSFAKRSQAIHDDNSLSNEKKNELIDDLKKQQKEVEDTYQHLHLLKNAYADNTVKINEMSDAIEVSNERIRNFRKQATEELLKSVDVQIQKSELAMSAYTDTSSEYRAEQEKQIGLLQTKMDIVNAEREAIETRLSSGKLSTDQIKLENERLNELNVNLSELGKKQSDLRFSKISSEIKESADKLQKYDDELKISKERMEMFDEKSKEYSAELTNQTKILKDKLSAEEAHEAMIRKSMETVGLTAETYAKLKDELRKTILAQADTIGAMKQNVLDQQKKIADDVIEIYKTMYEKQKEVRQKALEKEEEELEKSHKKKVDALDKEMKKYEELVQAKLKALDDQASEDDYNKQLAKMQKERDEIQKQIDIKSLNNSPEAKAALAELNKKLEEKNEEIDKLTTSRSREVQKKNLQEQLDDKKKNVDAEKEAADKTLENEKERIKKQKEYWDRYYDNLINDERRFTQIREEIMRGSLDRVKTDFEGFKAFLVANNETIGQSISFNLSDKMDTVSSKLQTTSELLRSTVGNLANEFNNNLAKALDNVLAKLKEMDNLKFGNMTSQISNISSIIDEMRKNSIDWHSSSPEDQKKLEQRNEQLGGSIGAGKDQNGEWSKDGKQLYSIYYVAQNGEEQQRIDKMKLNSQEWNRADQNRKKELEQANQWMGENLGATYRNGTWFKNGLPLYHDGGIVGGKGSPLMERLHKMLNLGDDEELSILKQGELVIKNNPIDIISNLISKIKLPDFSNLSFPNATPAAGPVYNTYSFRIDNVTGTREGAKDVIKEIVKQFDVRGKK